MSETKNHFDDTKMNTFLYRVFRDISGTYTSLMCCIGDRLNLFKKLEAGGPMTMTELSKTAGINERYSKEWLNAMACAGYLEYDPSSQHYRLPPEHAPMRQALKPDGTYVWLEINSKERLEDNY